MARKIRKSNPWVGHIIKYIVVVVFICFFGIFLYKSGVSFLQNAEMFKITEVIHSPALGYIETTYLDSFKGKSLFDVDLRSIQRSLQRKYPDMDRLRVVMVFPNRLVIQAQTREPFVLIENPQKNILVDRAGIVIHAESDAKAILPRIKGIKAQMQQGILKPYPERDVELAIKIITTIMTNPYLNSYRVETVSMAQRSKIELYLKHGVLNLQPLLVILDSDRIEQKIQKLGILLTQGDLQLQDVKYIDLRFSEPILSKK